MTVRTRPRRSKTSSRLARRAGARASGPAADAPAAPPQQPVAEARERAAGGPEDRAAYSCSCGYVFEAAVSTTVGCPHCGDTQAW